ncbi:MBOAT family O-acyltransferase [Brevundimonas sp.]|uniref:MBOAT family O-acyltransferase n=1 Tax=Brevundimonas sp. TaxID=1871086 RepID=UPI002D6C2019|nr:MBOAT family O-acyltransferase [Brevundimonas sp.]HYC75177.1 MBOAT family O-acyltransferase [Brevundimonas sp.]
MNFHSIDYLLFLPVVVVLYYAVPQRFRWLLLLLASNAFYGSWRLEFLPLLWLTTGIDYAVGRVLPEVEDQRLRRLLLALSLTSNLGLLLFFKYFALAANTTLSLWHGGEPGAFEPIDIILPLGISFYTFQTLGYVIDVYRRRREPETHLGYFAVYVMYFPQLIAGPIERPGHLLPQLRRKHVFDVRLAAAGGAMMLIGYFKKLVIADRLAQSLPAVLTAPQDHSPLAVVLASIGSIYQYYADISGYADIAIGSSLVLGIRLSRNFNRPLAAASISEFWQRWHITVTTWFRDYVYMPIARAGRGRWRKPVATVLTIVIISFWHGAAWTWLAAGLIAGTVMIAEGAVRRNRGLAMATRSVLGAVGVGDRGVRFVQDNSNRLVLWLFLILLGSLVNAADWTAAMELWIRMGELPAQFGRLGFSLADVGFVPRTVLLAIIGLELYQWLDARRPVFDRLSDRGLPAAWAFYYAVAAAILVFGTFDRSGFIYFNF